MAETINGYSINEAGDPAPWGTKENNIIGALCSGAAASGSRLVDSQHIHDELWASEASSTPEFTLYGGNATVSGDMTVSGDISTVGGISSTGSISCPTINTGQGANELYAMDQDVQTTDAVTFSTVNTGQGDNELYAMDQDVQTTDDVKFNSLYLYEGAYSGSTVSNHTKVFCDAEKRDALTVFDSDGNKSTVPLVPSDDNWTDFSSSMNPEGWSSTTVERMFYKVVDDLVFVSFKVVGTSNSIYVFIDLPYRMSTLLGEQNIVVNGRDNGALTSVWGQDSGITSASFWTYAALYGYWTASGDKQVMGSFWYRK